MSCLWHRLRLASSVEHSRYCPPWFSHCSHRPYGREHTTATFPAVGAQESESPIETSVKSALLAPCARTMQTNSRQADYSQSATSQLQLYEQRREARLREARDWFTKNYFARNMEESMRIAAPGTDNGALVMMVFSYWEQACALLNYGLLHEDLFFETSGEFFGVWERVRPIIAEGRKMFSNPGFLAHLEKAAGRFEAMV